MSAHRYASGVLATVLATVLALALVACGGDAAGDQPGEPALTEPRLTLALEGVALPEGVSADDIVVEPVAIGEDGATAGEGGPVAAFRLGPDSLVFATPLPVSIELPASAVPPGEGVTFLLLLTSADGTSELLPVEDAQRDPADGRVRLVASVPHFSELRVMSVYTPIDVDFTPAPGEDFALGSYFTVSAVVHRPRSEREHPETTITFGDGTTGRFAMRLASARGPWSSRTWWTVNNGSGDGLTEYIGPRSSSSVPVAPLETDAVAGAHAAGATVTPMLSQEFRCERAGPFRILFYVGIQQPGTQTLIGGGETIRYDVTLSTGEEFVAMSGRCVQGTSTPTPTPTGSPTPTSTPAVAQEPWEAILEGGEAVSDPLRTIVRGQVIVFVLDGVPFAVDGLQVTGAHEPFCSYTHVHGGPIRSIVPANDGRYVDRAEHLAECGYGPPDFRIIRDPR